MKITILQGAFLPVPTKMGGAVEKMWYALGIDFANHGHKVTHISRKYTTFPSEEIIFGVTHKRVKGYSTPNSSIYLKWLDLLYTIRAIKQIPTDTDIVVTNTFWAPILLPPFLKKKCMVDVQRMPKYQTWLYSGNARLRSNSSPVLKAIQKETFKHQYKNIVLIPNPIPFQEFLEINFKSKLPIILYVGRIHPEKGLDILINAFINIKSSWILQIVGPSDIKSGGGGKFYVNKLKKLACKHRVTFMDPIFEIERLNSLYKDASIFIYPSVADKGETFGLAPLEAMSWGCTPIVSNLACFKDFIQDGKNGLIFDHHHKEAVLLLGKKIIQLQNDNEYRISLAKEALKVRKSHSLSVISKAFQNEFNKMKHE